MSYRPVFGEDQSVIQQSLTIDSEDYKHFRISYPMLGVILSVYPADVDQNRSAMQAVDRKGHTHECTVQIVNDGSGSYTTLENVIITPDSPTGLDDYEERLPRGSSALTTGAEYKPNLNGIDPHDLDGDWCVVGFLGGRIDSPFIIRYWPHARNTLDAATSGGGLNGDFLVQDRRYFRRTNGVETVVTSEGNILLSTTFANSVLTPGEDPVSGRIARTLDEDVGGSVKVVVKPSQTLEIDFNTQVEGVGIFGNTEPQLPQLNPPVEEPVDDGEKTDTYLFVDKNQVDLTIPVSVTFTSGDFIRYEATNKVTLEAEKLYLGQAAEDSEEDPVVLGEKLREWFTNPFQVLSPFGPLKIDPTVIVPSSPYDTTLSEKSFVE